MKMTQTFPKDMFLQKYSDIKTLRLVLIFKRAYCSCLFNKAFWKSFILWWVASNNVCMYVCETHTPSTTTDPTSLLITLTVFGPAPLTHDNTNTPEVNFGPGACARST